MINQDLEDIKNAKKTERFIDVVHCVISYYLAYSGFDRLESGDEWKRKSGIIKPPVPSDLDKMIKEGFKKQLERYK